MEAGKFQEASINYHKAIQKNPKSVEAYFRLGLSDLKQKKGGSGLAALTQAWKLDPSRVDIAGTLAEADVRAYSVETRLTRLYDQARSISDQLLAKNPNSGAGLHVRAELFMLDGKPDLAAATLRKLKDVEPGRSQITVELIGALMRARQLAEAELLARSVIESDKSNGDAYDLLYRIYVLQGRGVDAGRVLESKVSSNPDQARYRLQLASYYLYAQKKAEMDSTLEEILADGKLFPQGPLQVGDFYAGLRDFERAGKIYQNGIKLHPSDTVTYQKRIAAILAMQKKTGDALQETREILKEQPRDQDAAALQASLFLEAGESDAAIAQLEKTLKSQPGDLGSRYELGLAYESKGDLDSARNQFLLAASKEARYLPPRLSLAQLNLRTHRYDEALRYANDVVAQDPRNFEAHLVKGAALRMLRKYPEARTEISQLAKDYPGNTDVELQAAYLDLADGRTKEAEGTFFKLYKPGQADLRPLTGLVQAYVSENQKSKAADLLTAEASRSPNPKQVRMTLAAVLATEGNLNLAIEQYQQALSNDPRDPTIYVHMGELYEQAGENEKAFAVLAKASELAPNSIIAILESAQVLRSLGRPEQAKDYYERALALSPNDPVVMNNLAYVLAETGHANEALPMIQQALRIIPKNPHLQQTLGFVYWKKNMTDSAIQVFHQLKTQHPQIIEYRVDLAQALLSKGDRSEARSELEAVLTFKLQREEEIKVRRLLASTN